MATLIETAAAPAPSTTGTSITVVTGGAPSAGERLIAVVHHTDDYPSTPSGWSKDHEQANSGVVTVFSKTASGSEGTSFTFTAPTAGAMNARLMRYTNVGAVESVSSFFSESTGSTTSGTMNTTIADLLIVAAAVLQATTLPAGDVTPSSGFTALGPDLQSTNSGKKSQLNVVSRTVATTGNYQYTATFTPSVSTSTESIAVSYISVSPDGNIAALAATATARANVPTVSGSGNGSVAAVRGQATAQFEAPAVSGETMVTGGAAGTATAQMIAPTVTANGNVSVTAVRMIATALMSAPTIPASVTAVAATATALLRTPAVSGGVVNGSVTAVRAQATATARAPEVRTMTTLPANISLGRITARFGTAEVLEGDLDGIADLIPITDATITFTSTAPILLDDSATPAPVTILPKPITCHLDAQGYLVDAAGHRWCDLIATDDPDVRPSTRKWRVTFTGTLSGLTQFDMVVPSGGEVDLAAVIPI